MGRLVDVDEVSKYVIIGNGVLRKVPTVEAIPVIHAYWIKRFYNCYECSNCHNLENMLTKRTNYCKDCGAKMDKKIEMKRKDNWIPVSERLPKIADVYRVTRYYPNNVMNPNYIVDACFFDGSNTWYNDNRINHERAYADNVIAWQENPEPYKAESEDKE